MTSTPTSAPPVDVRPRCRTCHRKLKREHGGGCRCQSCGFFWSGAVEDPLHTIARASEDAPRARPQPKHTVSEPYAQQPEEGNSHAVIEGRNGTLLLVEWRPARGVFRIGGLPDTQPPHPRWHEMSCIFRRSDVEWFPPGRENGHAVSVAAGP